MIEVRRACASDAGALAPMLRRADLCEIHAATGESALAVLERGIASSSPCQAVVLGGRPLALFGVVPDGENRGIVWLLGSDELGRHPRDIAVQGRAWIAHLHRQYSILWNYVDARNEQHLKWLAWCGFTVVRTVDEYGVERRPFHQMQSVGAAAPRDCARSPSTDCLLGFALSRRQSLSR